jgi:hypothetical protein
MSMDNRKHESFKMFQIFNGMKFRSDAMNKKHNFDDVCKIVLKNIF